MGEQWPLIRMHLGREFNRNLRIQRLSEGDS
jgi:hypothetical protein